MPTDSELAWAAGLFEGEGTMTLNGEAKSPRMKLSMVDRDVVQRFHKIVEVGQTYEHRDTNGHQNQLAWYVSSKADVSCVLGLLMPYFGQRRTTRAARVLTRVLDAPFEGWDAYRAYPRKSELNRLLQFED